MKLGVHYPILSFCMFEIFHLSESSVPSPSSSPQSKALESGTLYHNLGLKSQESTESLILSIWVSVLHSDTPVLAPYLVGRVCHAVAATHAGYRWRSSGWVWGSTLLPPVLPRGSPRIQTTVDGRRRLWGAQGHTPSCRAMDPVLQPHSMTCRSFNMPSTSCFCLLSAMLSSAWNTEHVGLGCLISNWNDIFLFPSFSSIPFSMKSPPFSPTAACVSSLELT